ncbi:MAG TPA: penicillin-binding transpeptidase domain-containing protein [Candidatus Limnocylindria bacterium]|nr:penicillin-binding transpeptidase domain-containing protein [Candidatus Limnocylindria bacterium]
MSPRGIGANIRGLTLVIALAFLVTSFGAGYWTLVAAEELGSDPFNPRLVAAIRDRPRGAIVDSAGGVLAESVKSGNGYVRRYRDRTLAHVVGYASFKYGTAGIEAAYSDSLVGQDPADPLASWRARYLGERDAPGAVVLGIDPKVQAAAAGALAATGRRGAIVALDPRTGTILASASLPNFDPNQIVDPATEDVAWQQVNGNADRPLIDRARSGLYPPGSTFKIVTGAAALESGVDPDAKVRVDDPWQADPSWGPYHVRSASRAHGDFTMSDAFRLSENIYFAKVGLQIGGQRLGEYAQRFGIGAAPRCDISAAKGQLSGTGALDRPTLIADTAYGQGELLASPLQMALVAAAIGRGGVMPTPHYATEVRDAAGNTIRTIAPGAAGQVIRPDTAARVTQMLVAAVSGPGAFAFGAKIQGVNVAGKTGTAENPQGSPHGWFVGFAPAEAPVVAVAVIIENAGQGGVDAAPLGGRVMQAALGR